MSFVQDQYWPNLTLYFACLLQFLSSADATNDILETFVNAPVFDSFDQDSNIVGNYFAVVPWFVYFSNELPEDNAPVHLVVDSTCGNVFTYEIAGRNATLLSPNQDLHDPRYDGKFVEGSFGEFAFDAEVSTAH